MLQFDKEIVKKIMMEENEYSDAKADRMMAYFSEYDSKLQPVLDCYIANRSFYPNFNVEGVTLEIVIDKSGCNFWNAISDLNFYLGRPGDARELLRKTPHLKKNKST